MPTDDIYKLDGPELSAAVAREVMGWMEQDIYWWSSGTPVCGWRPHKDRNDSHRVLKRCESMGLGYGVWTLLPDTFQRDGWLLLTIDPATICRAALRAVRASK